MLHRCLLGLAALLLSAASLLAQARPQVLVETSKGPFILELFNETPIHRDNFLRLVDSRAYEGVQFHRVIKDFMIQTGHLGTKGLNRDAALPQDSTEGTIAGEFHPELFVHVRGALAAARQPDDINPEMRSSACQFYIVTGKYYTDFDLKEQEAGRSCPPRWHLHGLRSSAGRLGDGRQDPAPRDGQRGPPAEERHHQAHEPLYA